MAFGNRDRGFNSAPREMHDAVCTGCGQATQVPFKPTEGRPVFCRECYAKQPRKERF